MVGDLGRLILLAVIAESLYDSKTLSAQTTPAHSKPRIAISTILKFRISVTPFSFVVLMFSSHLPAPLNTPPLALTKAINQTNDVIPSGYLEIAQTACRD